MLPPSITCLYSLIVLYTICTLVTSTCIPSSPDLSEVFFIQQTFQHLHLCQNQYSKTELLIFLLSYHWFLESKPWGKKLICIRECNPRKTGVKEKESEAGRRKGIVTNDPGEEMGNSLFLSSHLPLFKELFHRVLTTLNFADCIIRAFHTTAGPSQGLLSLLLQ